MAEVNLKNAQSKLSDQRNEEDGSHGSKKKKKSKELQKDERQGNDVAHLLPNLVFHLDEEKREVKGKAKRGKGEDPLVRLCLHRLLIPRALRVWKKTKKQRGSILYQIKINLNGTSCLSLYLMQTLSLRNIFQRKAFTTQSVKYISYQIT